MARPPPSPEPLDLPDPLPAPSNSPSHVKLHHPFTGQDPCFDTRLDPIIHLPISSSWPPVTKPSPPWSDRDLCRRWNYELRTLVFQSYGPDPVYFL
ncbi:hypothetical protein AALP_AA2G087400 [Arabis alpina]|uniref:Uncharacterized protein n=1 Tax=Arabis alpina TaxID=50452 RepID=A0A087HG59_ARAAL|nr:hypothetical protein AALP_AA2G087400 [Arabis alpina]